MQFIFIGADFLYVQKNPLGISKIDDSGYKVNCVENRSFKKLCTL